MQLEAAIGGRQAVIDALSTADLDEKQQHLLRLLADPARERDSLATICGSANVAPSALLNLFRQSAFSRAYAVALTRVAEALPAMVADVAAKSVDRWAPCPRCGGGEQPKEDTCQVCQGTGRVWRESDLERQRLLWDAAGLSKKSSGITITQQVGVATGSAPTPLFSRIVRATDAAAYADAEVVDGEPEASHEVHSGPPAEG